MSYADIRAAIKSGDTLLWQGHGLESWIVRAFTGSSYSHIGIAWVISGRVFVLEAALTGIRIYPLSRRLPFYWMPIFEAWTPEAEEFALAHVGDEYSRWEAIKGYFGMSLHNPSWQCAEFVIDVCNKMNLHLHCRATPEHVVEKMMQCGTVLTKVDE